MRSRVPASSWKSTLSRVALTIGVLSWAATAQAASVTTNEAAMDAIFSQASFGADPLDIVWDPVVITHALPNLLSIDNGAELGQLFALHDSATDVYAYFVDSINWCGVSSPGFVGCADLPGDDFVVESATAASGSGGELNAHELGHNLGLPHTDGDPGNDPMDEDNLMWPFLNGDTSLTAGQAGVAQGAARRQGLFGAGTVTIHPVLIVVPEPGTAALLGLGLAGCAGVRRRARERHHA